MTHLAFPDQFPDRSSHVFHGNVGIDTMLVEQVYHIRSQTSERFLCHLTDAIGMTVQSLGRTSIAETEFGGDHHIRAKWRKRLAQQGFVGAQSIGLGGIEKCDTTLISTAKELDGTFMVLRRAITETEPHAAQSESRDFQPAFPQNTLIHLVASSIHFVTNSFPWPENARAIPPPGSARISPPFLLRAGIAHEPISCVAHGFHPGGRYALEAFGNGDMAHGAGG